MRKNKALKVALFITSTALFLSIPSAAAHAEELISAEQGVAGIAALLEITSAEQIEDAYNASIQTLEAEKKEKEEKEENISPYANLGVSIADSYVNIRKEPSTDSEQVGKLYRGCAADILEYLEGDWVKIKSGDVEGYIASNFLAIGKDAEAMVDEYAEKWVTVNTQTLRVREDKSTESDIITLIPIGEKYLVKKEYKEWYKILLGNDDSTNDEYTGFVNKDFVTLEVKFKYAISIEEENRLIKEQQEREQAEKEREAAQAEAVRKEAERLKEQKEQKEVKSNSETSSNQTVSVSSDSSSNSSLRQQIVDYALKFVGNPYVWGGESLTYGADCSGFVKAVYEDFGYYLPRVSRDQAASAGVQVNENELLPGDLLFYASGGTVSHVAMYIGNGKIVHAATQRQGIITSNYKYRDIYCARRIVH